MLVIVGVAFLAAGAALAARQAGTTVAITGTSVTAKWHESYVLGSVTFTGSESQAATLEASLRNVATGRLIAVKRFSVGGGTFTQSIQLSARPAPGTYRLRLKEMPTGSAAERNV